MIKNISIGILIFLVLLLFFKQCKTDKTDWKAKYSYEHQKFDSIKNKQVVVQTTDQKVIKDLTGDKNAVGYAKVIQKVFYHDTVHVPYMLIKDTCTGLNRTFKNDSIAGKIDDKGVTIDSLKLNNSIAFKVTEKKSNYLIEAHNSNPAFKITGMSSIVLDKKKPSKFGLGPYMGYDIFTKKPSFGISINYQLIRF